MFFIFAWRAAKCLLDCFMKIYSENLVASSRSQVENAAYRNLHELAETLETLSKHLHSKNCVELGESGYYWHLAETLRKLGRLTTLPLDLPVIDEKFSDAYPPGTLAHEEQARHFLSLIGSQSNGSPEE